MRRGRLLLAVLCALLPVAAACSGGDDVDGATQPDGQTSGTEQPAGGEAAPDGEESSVEAVVRDAPAEAVVFASALAPLSMDPHNGDTLFDPTFLSMMNDRLLNVSNNLEIVPMLATEWGYVDGGAAFELTLRDDVVFHDGTPFNAEAVVANIEHAKPIEGTNASRALTQVEGAVAIDPTHVRLELAPGARNIPAILAGSAGFMISPKALADGVDLQATSAGSGPFRLESWVPREKAVFQPVEGYWDVDRQHQSEVHVVTQPSEQARLDGFLSGAYDVANVQGAMVDEALAAADAGGHRHLAQRQNSIYALFLDPTAPALESLELRRAIMYAIDRNDLVDGLFGGNCESRIQTFSLGSKFFFPELEEQFHYDPEEARRLVAESGIENPTFDVMVPEDGMYGVVAERIKPHLAAVGITININKAPLVDVGAAWQAGEIDAAYLAMPAFADPGLLLGALFLGRPPWQEPVIAATGADLGRLQGLAPDDDDQLAVYQDIFAGINDLALYVPGCSITAVWLWAPGIQGVDLMPNLWSGAVLPYTIDRREG